MNTIEAIIMGLVQGLTEFLPISSSAHLRVLGAIFGDDPGAAFTAITQIGTESAVLIYFWKDISRIVCKWFQAFAPARSGVSQSDPDVRMGWMIIVGSLPIGILGLLGQDWIEKEFRNMWITVVMLIVFALFLGAADRFGKKDKTLDHLSWVQAIIFGFAQALALVPGVSRSGGTITAGRLMGFTRVAAARYSFLLAMPAVFASGFYEAAKSVGNNPANPCGFRRRLCGNRVVYAPARNQDFHAIRDLPTALGLSGRNRASRRSPIGLRLKRRQIWERFFSIWTAP